VAVALLFRKENSKYLASKLPNVIIGISPCTDQKWDGGAKTQRELSQGKQFLKSNGTAEVSGMLKENLTVSAGHKGIGIN